MPLPFPDVKRAKRAKRYKKVNKLLNREIARVMGVDERQIRRWLSYSADKLSTVKMIDELAFRKKKS